MHAHARGLDALELRCTAIDLAGALDGDAKLVLAQAGGDVGVCLGEDIRVDAQRDAGLLAQGLCAFGEEFEFGLALDVEEENVGVESGVHLPGLLADAGEDDARDGFRCGAAHALQLAAGDDVESAAERR